MKITKQGVRDLGHSKRTSPTWRPCPPCVPGRKKTEKAYPNAAFGGYDTTIAVKRVRCVFCNRVLDCKMTHNKSFIKEMAKKSRIGTF